MAVASRWKNEERVEEREVRRLEKRKRINNGGLCLSMRSISKHERKMEKRRTKDYKV